MITQAQEHKYVNNTWNEIQLHSLPNSLFSFIVYAFITNLDLFNLVIFLTTLSQLLIKSNLMYIQYTNF